MKRMPLLFIGHGSPMNIILDNDFTRSLKKLGKVLPLPDAIMVISAHWLTRGTEVTCMQDPRQIYDFSGFPAELYEIKYQPPGAQKQAAMAAGIDKIRCSNQWGLDHASWAILKHIYPDGDMPVFEMSISIFDDMSYHYKLAEKLKQLRYAGILIIGSGNLIHNLRLMDYNINAEPFDWAVRIDEKIRTLLLKGKQEDLINYKHLGEEVSLAIPTTDHYIPLVYTLGLQESNEMITFIHEGIQYGSVSMRSFIIDSA